MAYEPYNWTTASYVNPGNMNHLEQGVAGASTTAEKAASDITKTNKDLSDLSGVVTTLNSNLSSVQSNITTLNNKTVRYSTAIATTLSGFFNKVKEYGTGMYSFSGNTVWSDISSVATDLGAWYFGFIVSQGDTARGLLLSASHVYLINTNGTTSSCTKLH